MTVAELIEELKRLPPEAKVIYFDDGIPSMVEYVLETKDPAAGKPLVRLDGRREY